MWRVAGTKRRMRRWREGGSSAAVLFTGGGRSGNNNKNAQRGDRTGKLRCSAAQEPKEYEMRGDKEEVARADIMRDKQVNVNKRHNDGGTRGWGLLVHDARECSTGLQPH